MMERFARTRGAVDAVGIALRAAPGHLVGYIVLTLLSGGFPVAAAWCVKAVLDEVTSAGADPSATLRLAVLLAVIGVLGAIAPGLAEYLVAQARRAVGITAQDQLYRKVSQFDGLAKFEDPEFLNRLRTARLSGEQAPIQLLESLVNILRSAVTIGGFAVSVWLINPAFTVVIAVSAIPVVVAELALARRRARTEHGVGAAERREFFYGSLLTTIQAAKEIRLFGLGDYFRSRMRAERRTANVARRAVDRRTVVVQGGTAALAACVAGIGLVWVAQAAVRGQVSAGEISVFIASIAAAQSGLAGLASTAAAAHQSLLEFEHFRIVLRAGPDLAAPTRGRAAPLRHAIELRDVWFRYSPDHPWVLRGLNLSLRHGQATALVGTNGAGKSTLVKLLCRFYDPTRGRITWDGVDIRDIPAADLRARLGAVFQDYMEYDLTVAENIAVGDLSAFEEPQRVEAAAVKAEFDAKARSLPRGYDTMLSRMFHDPGDADSLTGVTLSGGQWQRVALARAYLRADPDLLILDEPSSGLDPDGEYRIHARLREHREGRTSLLISHRLSAVRDADQIAVLADGAVTESGTHDELLAKSGIYARLFTLQASGYRATPPLDAAPVFVPARNG